MLTHVQSFHDLQTSTNPPVASCASYPSALLGTLARVMLSLWSYLTFLSSIWFGSFVNCAVMLTDPLGPHFTNISLGIDIPAEFKITLEETPPGPPVPAVPCLDLAIRTVGQYLAPEEFTEKIGPQRWSMFDVVISTSTKWIPGLKIERRFVVWGIYEALVLFEGQKNFRSAIFTLAWRGDPVGYLAIYPEGLKTIDASFNLPATTELEAPLPTIHGISNHTLSSNLPGLENGALKLFFGYMQSALPLALHNTLLAILGALCDAARWPQNSVVPGRYKIRAGPARTQIDVQPEKILNYKWLIKALTIIPQDLQHFPILYSFYVKIKLGAFNLGLLQIAPPGDSSDGSNAFIDASFNVSAGSATASER